MLRLRMALLLALGASALPLISASAQTIDLGAARGYAALILPGGSIDMTINGGSAIVGDAGVSANAHLDLGSGAKVGPMAGTGQVVDGLIYLDPNGATVKLDNQDPNSVRSRNLTQAVNDAVALNQAAAGWAATQNFSTLDISSAFTITGNGGLNVIDLSGDIKLHGDGLLTLQGGASDYFVFNIQGTYTQSSKTNVVLAGGVTPDHVLWNFIGTGQGANIGTGSNGSTVGIFLAPQRDFSITDTVLNGSIITAGHLAIGSKSLVVNVPEIPTSSAFLIGLAFLAGALRLRRRLRI